MTDHDCERLLPYEAELQRSTIWTCPCGKDFLVALNNRFIPLPKGKYQRA